VVAVEYTDDDHEVVEYGLRLRVFCSRPGPNGPLVCGSLTTTRGSGLKER